MAANRRVRERITQVDQPPLLLLVEWVEAGPELRHPERLLRINLHRILNWVVLDVSPKTPIAAPPHPGLEISDRPRPEMLDISRRRTTDSRAGFHTPRK